MLPGRVWVPALTVALLLASSNRASAVNGSTAALPATPQDSTAAPSGERTARPSDSAAADFDVRRLRYQVRAGDTLEGIAGELLDSPERWLDVARLNDVRVPRHLQPGTVLRFLPEWLKSEPSLGHVDVVGGTARVDGQSVRVGETVTEGALIETGQDGITVIRLADGTQLKIPPASRVRIDRLRSFHADDAIEARMRLEQGAIEPVSPPNRRRPLDVRTPTGNAAVRGTDFRVRTAGGVDFVEVLTGSVDAGSERGRAAVDGGLGAAYGAKTAPRLEKLLPPPDLRALDERVFTMTRPVFDLPAVSRAEAYQVDVARDSQFTQLLVSTRVDIPELAVDTVEDGPLYLRLRGVSALGLDGRDAVARVDIQARPVAPRPLSPGGDDAVPAGPLELSWQPAADAQAYRVQVADDERFERLLGDVTTSGHSVRIILPPGSEAVRYWRVASIVRPGNASAGPRQGPFTAPQAFRQRARVPIERGDRGATFSHGDGSLVEAGNRRLQAGH